MSPAQYIALGSPHASPRPGRTSAASLLGNRRVLILALGSLLLIFSLSGVGYTNRDQIRSSLSQLSTSSASTSDNAIDWSLNGRGNLRTMYMRPKTGTAAWDSRYPRGDRPGPTPRPDWLAHYERVKAQGLIVMVPQANLSASGLAEYPEGTELDEQLCSYRRTDCIAQSDIFQGPPSTWALNWDDGPLPPSSRLHEFLRKERKTGTHFYIGDNVRLNWQLAVEAAGQGEHLAVHTWTHCHLTTRTDAEIIGELGWTMQIIYDLTGHVPRYYRPPYGDVDARVRSIARHVLGLRTVMWNADSEDWGLDQQYARGEFIDPPAEGMTIEASARRLTDRMREPEANVEGVIVLEHELSDDSIEAFVRTYPSIARHGWTSGSIPDLMDLPHYQ